MGMKKLALILLVLLLAVPAWAANTVTTNIPGMIIIIPDGSSDYTSTTNFPAGIKLTAIKFYPSAANDVLVIRNGPVATGTKISAMKSIDGGTLKDMFPGIVRLKPTLDASDCTFGTAANCIIIFEYLP